MSAIEAADVPERSCTRPWTSGDCADERLRPGSPGRSPATAAAAGADAGDSALAEAAGKAGSCGAMMPVPEGSCGTVKVTCVVGIAVTRGTAGSTSWLLIAAGAGDGA